MTANCLMLKQIVNWQFSIIIFMDYVAFTQVKHSDFGENSRLNLFIMLTFSLNSFRHTLRSCQRKISNNYKDYWIDFNLITSFDLQLKYNSNCLR